MSELLETKADEKIRNCIKEMRSFSVIAGAGSGKTTSLITALDEIRSQYGASLRINDQSVVCITYTNRAVKVIRSRLDFDELFFVSTLHSFLWGEISRFTPQIRETIRSHIIPAAIEKKRPDDTGKPTIKATAAREAIVRLEVGLEALDSVSNFKYNDTSFTDFAEGLLGHDDVIAIAAHMIENNSILQRILGQKYPFIFVDEAQDTFLEVVNALNKLCEGSGLPIVGYFGDPMQQIYESRAGDFSGPEGFELIPKEENFRCSKSVIDLLNAFRKDVEQYPAGRNAKIGGSVELVLVESQNPEGARNTYTDDQSDIASSVFDYALNAWGLTNNEKVKHLFLARQMIAKRIGFATINRLFTGPYASTRAQESYDKSDHYLTKPFAKCLFPIVHAQRDGNRRAILDILREHSPAFDPEGANSKKMLSEMNSLSKKLAEELHAQWHTSNLGQILKFAIANHLWKAPDILLTHLGRDPRKEEYNKNQHSEEKSDWLADSFFELGTKEIEAYSEFVNENTPYSTQHGVKGEEYKNIVVVLDDVEASWHNYSYRKTLTPATSGDPTEGQNTRTRKLAYVCFSRAEENLRILFFTPDPNSAKTELIASGLFSAEQTSIIKLPYPSTT